MEDGETSNLNYNILYCIYLPISLYYSLIITNDYTSNLIFFITLLTLTSVFKKHQRIVLIVQAAITIIDIVIKILIHFNRIRIDNGAVLDDRIFKKIMMLSIDSFDTSTLVYLGMVFLSWILPFVYKGREKESSQTE